MYISTVKHIGGFKYYIIRYHMYSKKITLQISQMNTGSRQSFLDSAIRYLFHKN